ncbi:MAG: regulator, partial [Oscillospiraceae bacterium]|nr:regulator [Oscillospiraceae bacterium]
MTSVFMKILNMSITSSIVIAAVLIARFILQRLKAPRKYSYLLWLAAAFRLCCPVSLKSVFSIFGGLRYISHSPAVSEAASLEYISIPAVSS